jgi:hypothetical protein
MVDFRDDGNETLDSIKGGNVLTGSRTSIHGVRLVSCGLFTG